MSLGVTEHIQARDLRVGQVVLIDGDPVEVLSVYHDPDRVEMHVSLAEHGWEVTSFRPDRRLELCDPRWVQVGALFREADRCRKLSRSHTLRGPKYKLHRKNLRGEAYDLDMAAIRLREEITGERQL